MAKTDPSLSSDKIHSPPASVRIFSNPASPSITSTQRLNVSMSRQKPADATCCNSSTKRSHSLFEIDNLEDRVICVDRKLMVTGFNYEPGVFDSYRVIHL